MILLTIGLGSAAGSLMDACENKLNRTLLRDALIRLYRGHIALYRYLAPEDIKRAVSNLQQLSDIITEMEIKTITSPVTVISQIDGLNTNRLRLSAKSQLDLIK